MTEREQKDTEDLLKCIPLFPSATPHNENEEHISLVETLVDDDDVTLLGLTER
jgi:hypothetical protein